MKHGHHARPPRAIAVSGPAETRSRRLIGAAGFRFLDAVGGAALPLDDGDRVVALQTWDAATGSARATSPRDFARSRDTLQSVDNVGAFRTVEQSIVAADGSDQSVRVAEMTAAGFEVARTAPLLGRVLVAGDEKAGEESVAVIGFDFWQSHFGGDPAVLGRQLTLSGTAYTVVGVMPKGFGFPVNHRLWIPLSGDPSSYLADAGPEDFVAFARLAPGANVAGADAEIGASGLLARADGADRTAQLRPRIVPYAAAFVGDGLLVIPIIQTLLVLLLVPPCTNVAILVYGRMLTRREEFAASVALEATRGRIVAQLFVEILLLAAGSAGLALMVAHFVGWRVEQEIAQLGQPLPFWMSFGLSWKTGVFVGALAVAAALIAGLPPALRATGGALHTALRRSAGRSGSRLGGAWPALVIAQVAFCLALLPSAAEISWGVLRPTLLGPGFAADQVLTARLTLDRGLASSTPASAADEERTFASRLGRIETELVGELEAEPGVSAVSVAASVPSEQLATVEIEGGAPATGDVAESRHRVRINRVDGSFFSVFDAPMLVGRGFEPGDFATGSAAVIVNRSFARDLFGDENPVGRRISYRALRGESETATTVPVARSFEIVGVVADVHASAATRIVYHAADRGDVYPARLALRVGPDRTRVADLLRTTARALDPDLRVEDVAISIRSTASARSATISRRSLSSRSI